ncbi:MAG: LuxR family transcriptional regulator [Pseudomonadota bacterium]
MMHTLDINHYNNSLSSCSNLEQAKSICLDFCAQIGWSYYLFGVIDATSLSAPKITTITNYPDGWWALYFKENMQKCDPVVNYCFEKTSPIRWDHLMKMEKYNSPASAQMMSTAATFGLTHGFSVPIKSPSGEVAIFSLVAPEMESLDEQFIQVLPYAQSLSYSLLDTYIRLKGEVINADFKITPREKECLFWACEGKTAWEIAQIIGITERTVIFHMTGATKKLGAANRQHAVAKAIMHGLIKPVP